MAVTHDQLLAQWGTARLIYFPLEQFLPLITVGPEVFPPDGAMPVEVPILFTVAVEQDGIHLFSVLRLQLGDDEPTALIVVGAVPDSPEMLFCLDPATGTVNLLDLDTPAYELVNSSFADFVEFLYRLDELIQEDPGGTGRAAAAYGLRNQLTGIDPTAFTDPESWWSTAFIQLTSHAA
jgi:hypothetical protein